MNPMKMLAAAGAIWLSLGQAALAGQTNVAVASNFIDAAKEIAAAFKARTGHEAVLSFGASGQFYTQITQDAPFQVFLSADAERPQKLADEGLGDKATKFTYAIGRLVLWSKATDVSRGEEVLKNGSFAKLAIANPASAPYGAAAIEAMKKLGVYETLTPKIVQGNNIAQTFQFVDTGNAELGFVALSQLKDGTGGSRWTVPQALYPPIKQDAVLLKKGQGNEAATAFMAFLKTPEAAAIIKTFGYAVGGES
jgi:molybdate transport system substrate-binding protein